MWNRENGIDLTSDRTADVLILHKDISRSKDLASAERFLEEEKRRWKMTKIATQIANCFTTDFLVLCLGKHVFDLR